MPSPVDLTGKVFGQLEVLSFTGAFHHDSKRSRIWSCHCQQCGRNEEIPQNLLPYNASQSRKRGIRYACSVCSRGDCVVCGGEITRDTKSNTCSDACQLIKVRDSQNLHYAKKSVDPDYNKQRHSVVVERMVVDPDYAETVRAIRREANKSYSKKEGVVELARAYQAERWRVYKAGIQLQRQRFWDSLSLEEQEARRESIRLTGRESKRRFYEWLRANPVEQQQYADRQRVYRTERNRQIELAKLQQTFVELNKHE